MPSPSQPVRYLSTWVFWLSLAGWPAGHVRTQPLLGIYKLAAILGPLRPAFTLRLVCLFVHISQHAKSNSWTRGAGKGGFNLEHATP